MTSKPERVTQHNRDQRIEALRQLERLLKQATAPGFRGTVGVEIPAKDGRLGNIRSTRVMFTGAD